MNLYIRADATGKIGAGHIMRCIAFAQAWQDQGGEVTFISHCESDAIRERIVQEGFNFIPIEYPHPHLSDLAQTLNIIESKTPTDPSSIVRHLSSVVCPPPSGSAWLVLDGYHFTPDYQKAIREAGIHLLVIDDMNHLPHYHADILLNQNIHAPDLNYHCDKDTSLLLGTRYVLLRREFLKYRNFKRQIPDRAKNILVTLGGADPDNATLKVIQVLNLIGDPNIEVKIVVGPTNQNIEKLQKELTLSPFTFHLLPNVNDMPELMAWADMAVSAGGSTCWELAFMGVPSIVLVLAENQAAVAEYLLNKKAVLNLGIFAECSKEHIRDECKTLIDNSIARTSLSQQSTKLINGPGPNPVIKSMNRNNITLREVTDLDRELIWQWANDEETRKASYSQAYISWDEHILWFDSVQRQKNHRFYIANNGGKKPVGQIRFASDDKDTIVSFSVAPDSRRRGYGKEILVKAAAKLFNETNIEQISAYVKSENMLSLRVFQKAGFRMMENVVFCGVKSCKMILRRPALS